MGKETNLVYVYDGTLEGFLCCVYESFARRQVPTEIHPRYGQTMLFEQTEWINTNIGHSDKVYASLAEKICLEAQDFVRHSFLVRRPDKEILMYRFIRMGYRLGRRVFDHLTDETVDALTKAVRNLHREAHLLKGFARFTDYNGVMVACISPKNIVLPLLSEHFADRFPDEVFMIYDKTHQMAVVHKPEGTLITSMRELSLPPIEDAENAYRTLWQCFYRTIAIEARENPKCRMNMMPRRFWHNMTEFDR
ncbi:MAG: TIGR03915 family putative DNA repair protein [Clostridiales bacterium]|nr:TIGR03915 family putative DNA repair protein [Clostridiales bacterium]